jgi:hypothetical protein
LKRCPKAHCCSCPKNIKQLRKQQKHEQLRGLATNC